MTPCRLQNQLVVHHKSLSQVSNSHHFRAMNKMEDKVVLITGASSGIGAATVKHFADIGYKKFSVVARREEKLKELAEKCKVKGAKDVLILPLNLSDMECAKSAVVKTVAHFNSE